jgi:hypothetical protein
MMPGAVLIAGQGKHYPGESLPRWTLELVGRSDGQPIWTGDVGPTSRAATFEDVQQVTEKLARSLKVPIGVLAAFEDPWHFVGSEAALPPEVDALQADLDDPEERRRLARVLRRGLRREVGYAPPLARVEGRWVTDTWRFRRGRLFLLPGDGPSGYASPEVRLGATVPEPELEPGGEAAGSPETRCRAAGAASGPRKRAPGPQRLSSQRPERSDAGSDGPLRRASGREVRVFLPPASPGRGLPGADDRGERRPSRDRAVAPAGGLSTTPIAAPSPLLGRTRPGRAGGQPSRRRRAVETAAALRTAFEAALHAGLHSEKYLPDGRISGSGGGHHITLGGPTPLESPLLVRPDVLASLITFFQHHPSLSYFTGLSSVRPPRRPGWTRGGRCALRAGDRPARAFDRGGSRFLPGRGRDVPRSAGRRLRQYPPRRAVRRQAVRLADAPRPSRARWVASLRDARASQPGGGSGGASPQPGGLLSPGSRTRGTWSGGGPGCMTGSSCPTGCGATSRRC